MRYCPWGSQKGPVRIAFQDLWNAQWNGGASVLEILLSALRSLEDESLEIVLLSGRSASRKDHSLGPMLDEVIRHPLAEPAPAPASLRMHLHQYLRKKLTMRGERILGLSEVLNQHNVDCFVSYSWKDNPPVDTPRLGWVQDFQYRHLPEMFSAEARTAIERLILSEASLSGAVMLHGGAEKKDFDEVFPSFADKARSVAVVSVLPSSAFTGDPSEVLRLYGLPPKFFYMPNQLWKHKNHMGVLEAMHLLRKRGIEPFVVCTGHLTDPRHPSHLADVLQTIAALGLRNQVAMLGLVPRQHVYMLLRQSSCVLNPSLFEGIGLSVAEGVAGGKSLLVSDLVPFREQAPDATFFDPKSPGDLADKMAMAWEQGAPGPDLSSEAKARSRQVERQRRCGRDVLDMIHAAIAGHKAGRGLVRRSKTFSPA